MVCAGVLVFGTVVGAQALAPPPPRLTGSWGGARTAAEERGLTVNAAYTAEIMGQLTGERRAVVAGLAELGFDLDLGATWPRAGRFHVHAYAIHGEGLTDILGDLHGVSNIVAEPEVRLFEAWYEQAFGPVGLRVGLESADQEFLVSSDSLVLLNSTFGIPAQASINLGGPVYPVAAPAARVRVTAGAFTVTGGIFDGEQANDHGIPTALGESALVFVEAAWEASVKVGGWFHTERADALYAVFDRALGRGWASFARVSWSPGGAVELYADAGVTWSGVAVGAAFSAGDRRELVVEATYAWQPIGWLAIQPDLQWIVGDEQHLVLGLRSIVDL